MNNLDGIKIDMVGMDEAMQDPTAEFMGEAVMSVDAIPDLNLLTNSILEILEYLKQPDVVEICRFNESAIRMNLINKYADIVPIKMIGLFMEPNSKLKQDHIDRTFSTIETLAKVKAGELELEDAYKSMTDSVFERFAYKEYGSKEAFEAAIQKELAKQKPNQSKGF